MARAIITKTVRMTPELVKALEENKLLGESFSRALKRNLNQALSAQAGSRRRQGRG